MCVWFSLSNSLTSVSLTAGTEKPFSSCKLWYPRRRVGQQLLLILHHKMNIYLTTIIPACHVPSPYCTEEKHGSGYLRFNCTFMLKIAHCCFNFYFSFKVLFIADAKISFDSFRNGMTASVNSKTIITVNPGKISQRHLHKHSLSYNCNWPKTSLVETNQAAMVYSVSRILSSLLLSKSIAMCFQTPERPVCCSATQKKHRSLVLWIMMRSQKTCLVGYSEEIPSVRYCE